MELYGVHAGIKNNMTNPLIKLHKEGAEEFRKIPTYIPNSKDDLKTRTLSHHLTTQLALIEKIIEGMEEEKEWKQCNDCFDGKHCEGKDIGCECVCIEKREKRIASREDPHNQAIDTTLTPLKEYRDYLRKKLV